VFLNGDFLDLMGGKYDPRNTLPGGLRPEYRGQDYFDLVIEDAVKFLEPYKDLLTVYAQGNHETNVKKRQHTDPLEKGGRRSTGYRQPDPAWRVFGLCAVAVPVHHRMQEFFDALPPRVWR
jgi:hypothetical protein